jgi:hypothetical protein
VAATNFEVLDLTLPEGRQILYALTLSKDRVELAMARVLELALLRAKSCVIEKLYVDHDYLSSYARFYSRVFRQVPKWCHRLHFFACEAKDVDLWHLAPMEHEYLGFCVVRPLTTFKTGRTIFRPPNNDDGQEYHLAIHTHEMNIFGTPMSIRGAAFLEQDARAAACASAAIWMASIGYTRSIGLRPASSTEITEFGTAFDVSAGRVMPSEGLTTAQMLQALRQLGFDPVLYTGRVYGPDADVAKNSIYSYVESQIPVIVGIHFEGDPIGHAITAIGHTYDSNRIPKGTALPLQHGGALSFFRSSEWTDSFVVHDDQRGPLRRLRFLDASEYPPNHDPWNTGIPITPQNGALVELECGIAGLLDASDDFVPKSVRGQQVQRAVITYILVPLPPGVALRAEEAELKAAHWIRGFPLTLEETQREALNNELALSEIALRTYLRPSNQYKQDIFGRHEMNQLLRASYRETPLPKYVWITEVSRASWMSKQKPEERLMSGEILNDCSSNPYTLSYVAIHLPGWFSRSGPELGDPGSALSADTWELMPDAPYRHLHR